MTDTHDPDAPRLYPLKRAEDYVAETGKPIKDARRTPGRRLTDQSNPHYPGGGCLAIDEIKAEMDTRFGSGKDRMDGMETLMKKNNEDTNEVLEIVRMGKGFFRVLGLIGTAIKWAVGIVAPVVALYYAIKGGVPTK